MLSVLLIFLFVAPHALQGADIEGAIIIKRTLTKHRVTNSTSAYQRGVAVELGPDRERDPIAFEFSRVAVYLEGLSGAPPVAAVMEQHQRLFVSDFLVVPVGSTVSFPNRDPIFHNVFSLSKPKEFDLGSYSKDQTRVVKFDKPGIVYVNCHLHPNMTAAIVVSPNQWSVKADGTGKFGFHGVPPGTYTVVAWHKTAGFFRKTIRLSADAPASVEFFIPLGAIEPAGR